MFFIFKTLHINCQFEQIWRKVDQQTGWKWFRNSTMNHKENQSYGIGEYY